MSHSQVSDNAIIQVMKEYKENFKILHCYDLDSMSTILSSLLSQTF